MEDAPARGRWERQSFESDVLRGNPLGDPHVRPLCVYLPPGYDDEPDRRWPSIYVLQGYTGLSRCGATRGLSGRRTRSRPTQIAPAARGHRLHRRVDRVRRLPVRRLARHRELPHVPLRRDRPIRRRAPTARSPRRSTAASRASRAAGSAHSSRRCCAPTCSADSPATPATRSTSVCYLPEFPEAPRSLRDKYEARTRSFWEDFRVPRADEQARRRDQLMTYGMRRVLLGRDDGTVTLPFDIETGRLIDDVWERWLAWDPVRHGAAVRRRVARAAGDLHRRRPRDDWFLDLGAKAIVNELAEIGVTDVFFELFDATHRPSSTATRWPRLPGRAVDASGVAVSADGA